MTKVLISVISYKRPQSLKRLLMSLANINTYNLDCSILVVDNDCCGDNARVISEINSQVPINLVEEKEQGIPYARNKAVEAFLETNDEYLVFIDDDETVDENWLQELLNAQKETNADIVSGKVVSRAEDSTIDKDLSFLHSNNKNNLDMLDKFYTTSLLVKRCVLENIVSAFDVRFRYTGSSDLHFSLKCIEQKYKAVYAEKAVSYEWVQSSRINAKWVMKRGFRNGAGYTTSKLYIDNSIKTYVHCLVMGAGRLSVGFTQILLTKKNIGGFYKALMRISSGVGSFAGLLGFNYNEYKKVHGK